FSAFFFQAEDGIRDRNVTGVQTCALPIWPSTSPPATGRSARRTGRSTVTTCRTWLSVWSWSAASSRAPRRSSGRSPARASSTVWTTRPPACTTGRPSCGTSTRAGSTSSPRSRAERPGWPRAGSGCAVAVEPGGERVVRAPDAEHGGQGDDGHRDPDQLEGLLDVAEGHVEVGERAARVALDES